MEKEKNLIDLEKDLKEGGNDRFEELNCRLHEKEDLERQILN